MADGLLAKDPDNLGMFACAAGGLTTKRDGRALDKAEAYPRIRCAAVTRQKPDGVLPTRVKHIALAEGFSFDASGQVNIQKKNHGKRWTTSSLPRRLKVDGGRLFAQSVPPGSRCST